MEKVEQARNWSPAEFMAAVRDRQARSWQWTAAHCPKPCCRANCSGMREAPSRERWQERKASSSWHPGEHFFSMKSGNSVVQSSEAAAGAAGAGVLETRRRTSHAARYPVNNGDEP